MGVPQQTNGEASGGAEPGTVAANQNTLSVQFYSADDQTLQLPHPDWDRVIVIHPDDYSRAYDV